MPLFLQFENVVIDCKIKRNPILIDEFVTGFYDVLKLTSKGTKRSWHHQRRHNKTEKTQKFGAVGHWTVSFSRKASDRDILTGLKQNMGTGIRFYADLSSLWYSFDTITDAPGTLFTTNYREEITKKNRFCCLILRNSVDRGLVSWTRWKI